MNAKIFSRTGEFAGTDFDIAEEAIIGRAPSSTIVLPGGVISQRHARIAFDAGIRRYVLEDLGSLNGTALDNVPVTRPTRLSDLHVITFAGVHDFIFRAGAGEAPLAAGRSMKTAPEEEAPTRPDPGPETAWVAPSFSGAVPVPAPHAPPAEAPGEDRTLHTIQSPVTSFEIPAALRSVETPRHAAIVVEDGRASITDLGSDNGTFIGDVRLSGATDVRPGTEITLGFYVKLIRRS